MNSLYELIHSGTHNDFVSLFKVKLNNHIYFLKKSLCEDDNYKILKEKNGFDWYLKWVSNIQIKIELKKSKYYELITPLYPGVNYKQNSRIIGNENVIERLVHYYAKKWPKDENFAIHGDLALCNIISNNQDIFIIDWEHFHLADKQYFGFDIFNMLFISLWYDGIKKFFFMKKCLPFLKKCYSMLFDYKEKENKLFKSPFLMTKKYILENSTNFGDGKNVLNKFIITTYDDDILKKLDRLIVNDY